MNPSRHLRSFRLAIAALGLAGAVLVPQARTATGIGGPGLDPSAGPIEITADAEVASGQFGPVINSTLVVENHGPAPVTVFLVGELAWPDGSTTRLRYGPPQQIDGNGALIILATSAVPDGVGSGPGTFTATGIVAMLGQGGRKEHAGRLFAQDEAPFTLP